MDLTTSRLRLRKVVPADIDLFVELDADPEVMRYISGGEPSPRSFYEGPGGAMERMCAYEGPLGFYCAEHEGRFIGWFHLRPSVADETIPEVGYRLRRDAWGKGFATEGSLRLCALAFALGYPAVDACTVVDNLGSLGVMKKCGMQRVGSFRHPRMPEGTEVERYLVTREAFEARR